MKGFAVISRVSQDELREKHWLVGGIWGINRLMLPYSDDRYTFNEVVGEKIAIGKGFEGTKLKMAYRMGVKRYGYSVSKDYNINYNPFFHYSTLIRGLDIMTIRLGCDLRLSEVVIADASTREGKTCFKLLAPFARRVILVTENKNDVEEEVDYAMASYGISVAVVEDPVKASDRADVLIVSSANPDHQFLTNINKPMLYLNAVEKPRSNLWFNDVEIQYRDNEAIQSVYAQGYLDINETEAIWINAEREGFRIKSLKKENNILIEL